MSESEALLGMAEAVEALSETAVASKDERHDDTNKEYQWDQASVSTASGTLSQPCSLPTTPDTSRQVRDELNALCNSPSINQLGCKTGKPPLLEAVVVEESLSQLESESEGDKSDPADLPSVGSAGHATGNCSRCCFHPKGRCTNGYNCEFCHFDHDKRKRKKKKKKTFTNDASISEMGLVFEQASSLGSALEISRECTEYMRVDPVTSFPPSGLHWAAEAGVPAFIAEPSWHQSYSSQFEQNVAYRIDAYGVVPNHSYSAASNESSFCSQQYMVQDCSAPVNYGCTEFPQQMVNLGADVCTWSLSMVGDWLVSNDLGDCVTHFDTHRITGDVLLEITNEDLQEMGVMAIGDRKRILRAIALLPRPWNRQQMPMQEAERQLHNFTAPSLPAPLSTPLPAPLPPPPPPSWNADEGLQKMRDLNGTTDLPDLISNVEIGSSAPSAAMTLHPISNCASDPNPKESDGLPQGWTLRDLLP